MIERIASTLTALAEDSPTAPTTIIAIIWGSVVFAVFFGLLWTVRGRVK